MPDRTSPISRLASRIGGYIDRHTLRPRPLHGRRAPLEIEPYYGYGTPDVLYVHGRVRRASKIRKPLADDSNHLRR